VARVIVDDAWQPFILVRREAKALLAQKLEQDKKYWKERDWEALQKKRQFVPQNPHPVHPLLQLLSHSSPCPC